MSDATPIRKPISDTEPDYYADQEAWLDEQFAKASEKVRNAKCIACNAVWVDVMNGEDTCAECTRNV